MGVTRPRYLVVAAVALVVSLGAAACSDDGDETGTDGPSTTTEDTPALPGDDLRLNEVQVVGSHNSYHLRAEPEVAEILAGLLPDLWETIEYEHLPLTQQLEEYGIRQFELDVFADPDGGLYATPAALDFLDLPQVDTPEMEEPGFKVQHIADIDYRTTCLTFVACLSEIEEWSTANPDHLPIMVMVETKGDDLRAGADDLGVDVDQLGVEFVRPPEMTAALFDDLEAELLSVFDAERIITPDDVRGDADTLEEGMLADGWPTIGESRGKVLFALVDTGESRDVYTADAPSLEGRVFFTPSEPGRADAAFLRVDDSLEDGPQLDEWARDGYLIRTRTDEPGIHAPEGDTSLRDSALASGGHYLSTDYYVPDEDTGYSVSLPDDLIARCNPVTAPPGCSAVAESVG